MGELSVLQKALELLTYTCESCSCLVLRDNGDDHETWHDSLEYEWPDAPPLRPVVDLELPPVVLKCVCGEPGKPGTFHRHDAPCHALPTPQDVG